MLKEKRENDRATARSMLMKEVDYIKEKEVPRFPVYSSGTDRRGERIGAGYTVRGKESRRVKPVEFLGAGIVIIGLVNRYRNEPRLPQPNNTGETMNPVETINFSFNSYDCSKISITFFVRLTGNNIFTCMRSMDILRTLLSARHLWIFFFG